MKRFQTWFDEFKEIYPDTHHDEIDCGIAWRYALIWVKALIDENSSCGETEKLKSIIDREIK